MLIEAVRELIGTPPEAYQHYEYVAVAAFALLIIYSALLFIGGLFKLFGGRR